MAREPSINAERKTKSSGAIVEFIIDCLNVVQTHASLCKAQASQHGLGSENKRDPSQELLCLVYARRRILRTNCLNVKAFVYVWN